MHIIHCTLALLVLPVDPYDITSVFKAYSNLHLENVEKS